MTNLQNLLDDLGPPPPEVCLDWAWQLEQLAPSNQDSASDRAELEWQDVTVDNENGILQLTEGGQTANSSGTCSAASLVQQLLRWGEQVNQTIPKPTSTKPTETLRKAAKSKPTRRSRWIIIGSIACFVLAVFVAVFLIPGNSLPPRKTASKQDGSAASKQMPPPRAIPSPGNPSPPNHRDKSNDNGPLQLSDSGGLSESNLDTAKLPSALPLAEIKSADLLTPSGEDSNQVDANEGRDNTSQATVAPQFVAPGAKAAQSVESMATDLVDQGELEISEAVELADLKKAEEVDVLAELDKVTKSASAATSEQDVAADFSSGASPEAVAGLEAMKIKLSPMMQLQKLPTTLGQRVREPAWRLRLEANEGFIVEPSTPQMLVERQVATWTIRDEDAKDPATVIGVKAAIAKGRVPNLQWQIVAGAADVPQIYVPLEERFLDKMQMSLNQLVQRLQFGIDQSRQITKTTGIPSELRSAIYDQRRVFESQLELASRALVIVADANQLVGWLDGQFTVHAELFDQTQRDTPPVLKFGEPQLPLDEPVAAEVEASP